MPNFADRKIVQYTAEQMFDLVADVGAYPEFLPWCVSANILEKSEILMIGALTIGFGPFSESFTSKVVLERPQRIRVTYQDGPFHFLNNQWVFTAAPQGTRVDFWIDFEFRNKILKNAIGMVFNEAVRRMVGAFLKRAKDVYGEPQ